MTEERKTFAIYAITKHGLEIAKTLLADLPDSDLYVSPKQFDQAPEGSLKLSLPMAPTLKETFKAYDCHIFVISVGAVVRMIAPLLENKKVDPAVVCVDDAAQFSICVLSGHVGRGNFFTGRVADVLGSQEVITTASDVLGTLAVDILGRKLGWTLDDPDRNVTSGCAAVVNERPVKFIQETGEPNWWPEEKPLPANVEYTTSLEGVDPSQYEILLIATDRLIHETHPDHFANSVIYRPKSLVIGLGCDKNTPADLVERGVLSLMKEHGLAMASVISIASIDKKGQEPALLAFEKKYGRPFYIYPAERLDVVPGIENPSDVVKKYTGSRGVAEPAALLTAGAEKLLVPKQKYTEPGADRNMTFAVARVPFSPRKTGVGS